MATNAPTQPAQTKPLPPALFAGVDAVAPNPLMRFLQPRPGFAESGSIPAGDPGGQATSKVNWIQADNPSQPSYLAMIDLTISLPVTVTLGYSGVANSNSVQVSPFAPYSAFRLKPKVSTASTWSDNVPLVVPWLKAVCSKLGWDPSLDLVNAGIPTAQFYPGPSPSSTPAALAPGTVLSNASTAANQVTNGTFVLNVPVRFLQRPDQMWGAMLMGDPNRPFSFDLALTALLGGTQPDRNLFVNSTGAGNSVVVGAGGVQVTAVYHTLQPLSVPFEPGSTTPVALPPAVVRFAAGIADDSITGPLNANSEILIKHQAEGVYTQLWDIPVANGAPVPPAEIAWFQFQGEGGTLYNFNAADSSLQSWYNSQGKRLNRQLPEGVVWHDFWGGELPAVPGESGFNGLKTAQLEYGAMFGVPATPNQRSVTMFAAGTAMANSYVSSYGEYLQAVNY